MEVAPGTEVLERHSSEHEESMEETAKGQRKGQCCWATRPPTFFTPGLQIKMAA